MIMIFRFIIGFILLGIGAYTDYKTRKASNNLWLIMGFFGMFFLLLENHLMFYLPLILLISGMMIIMFYLNLVPGGADVKAIIALAIFAPMQILSILMLSIIIMILSIIPLRLVTKKGFKELALHYPYPFLIPLWLGFIVSFFFPILNFGII